MAEKELELLDKVELRFALAENDTLLEKTLNSFLCPTLLKLASPNEVTRSKVLGILTHVNKRVRPKPSIKLPLLSLLQLYADNESLLVRNLSLVYIELGFDRSTNEVRKTTLSYLVKGISTRPPAQQNTIVYMIFTILSESILDSEEYSANDPLSFESRPADASFLLSRCRDLLLYRQPTPLSKAASEGASGAPPMPDGMSAQSVSAVTNGGKATWANTDSLKRVKIGVVKFISSANIFSEKLPSQVRLERFIALVVASTDNYHEVTVLGEDGLKRFKQPDLEDRYVVERLFLVYQGSNGGKQDSNKVDEHRGPGSNALKLKILGYLSKSTTGAQSMPAALQVAFDCLYGPKTSTKLVMAGMAFIQWMARMCKPSVLQPLSPILLSGLLKYTSADQQTSGMDVDTSKGFAYVAIGLLSRKVPEVFQKDLSVLETLFNDIAIQSKNVVPYIQEALSLILDAFKPLKSWATPNDELRILDIIQRNIFLDNHRSRYCALRYVTELFEFSHTEARYLCLESTADEKLEIKEEAKRGLVFPPFEERQRKSEEEVRSSLPSFSQFVQLINEKSKKTQKRLSGLQSGPSTSLKYPPEVYQGILEFLRLLMIATADPEVPIEDPSSDYELQQSTRSKLKAWLKDSWNQESDGSTTNGGLSGYLSLLEQALSENGKNAQDKEVQSIALSCLLELVTHAPSSLSQIFSQKISVLKTYIGSSKVEARITAARIIGVLTTDNADDVSFGNDALLKLLEELSPEQGKNKQVSVEQRHGRALAASCILGHVLYRYSDRTLEIIPQEIFNSFMEEILDCLVSKQSLLVSGACIGLGEIGRYGVFPSGDSEGIVDKLIEVYNGTSDVKVQEGVIRTLGHIAVGDSRLARRVLDFFKQIAPTLGKRDEVCLTVGEAIAGIGGGWDCLMMDAYADIADCKPSVKAPADEIMTSILDMTLREMTVSSSIPTRKAACIWLLSIVKFCPSHPRVKENLRTIHDVFTSLLSDRDEFTQEVASKGIGLVYDIGDQDIRTQLVESLVDMLEGGRKPTRKVTGETELFDNNTLGQAPDGTTLTTYQSILSLASDMNQPELVYKFMHLASHNAMWQSRKGAAFGFASIISQAESDLKPFMKKLVPRLYRYQYDPNPKVNEAMTSIWRALVKEPKLVVQEYFEVIVVDLLEGMGSRIWRTRESSCLAMADLLHGRSAEDILQHLETIWTMSFRTLDDIKESVRIAALKPCKVLIAITVKYCDPKNVSSAESRPVLDVVVPFLITKGLVSASEDVSKISQAAILKICKQAGPLLKPHISGIVLALLDSLTSLEPQMLNYLSFHTDKYQMTQEQLEGSRLSAVKLSPMMEGIDACIENMDEEVMAELSPSLLALIKRAVGLPTKAGCAHFVVSLCIKKPEVLRPFSSSMLRPISLTFKDKSPAVRKAYAVATGYMARLVTDAALSKFFEGLTSSYIAAEEEDARSISAIAIREVGKNAADRLSGLASLVMPTIYFGTFDQNKGAKEIWVEVWENHAAGSSTLKLFGDEIVALLVDQLNSPSWNSKTQSAMALADLSVKIPISKHVSTLLPLVISALTGRVWKGKEQVVSLLAAITVSGKSALSDDPNILQEVGKTLLRETKKSDKHYRRFAIDAMGTFLNAFPEVDFYDELKPILLKIIEPKEADSDGEEEELSKPLQHMLVASAFQALSKAWPSNPEKQGPRSAEFVEVLVRPLVTGVWNVKIAALEALERFFDKLDYEAASQVISEEALTSLLQNLTEGSLKDYKFANVRTQGFTLLSKIVKGIKGSHLYTEPVRAKTLAALDITKKDPMPAISDATVQLLKEA